MNKDFIVDQLKKQIENFKTEVQAEKVGKVVEVGDGIARISGLSDIMASEMVEFPNGEIGVALNLEEDRVGAMVLGSYTDIKEGDEVKTTGKILSIPVSDAMIGRVINPLGTPVDGKGDIKAEKYYPVEKIAPGVITRKSVNQPVQTGIKAIDAMIPIGRGQRELIIGDRQTGKTAIAIDTIINQKEQNMKCIYVAARRSQKSQGLWASLKTRRDGIYDRRCGRSIGQCCACTSLHIPDALSANISWTRAKTFW